MMPPGDPDVGAAINLVDPSLLASCTSFILSHLCRVQSDSDSKKPLLVGFNGLQGAGKTTLVSALSQVLAAEHAVCVLVLSIDDFYLPRATQEALATSHADNKLVQYRGEPGTHDVDLLNSVLRSVTRGDKTRIPRYDKSAFGGLGDRVPVDDWSLVNSSDVDAGKVQVILLEGWCVGFAALSDAEVEARWKARSRTLKRHKLEHLLFVNDKLREYGAVTGSFDAFIHLDAEDIGWVYEWRLEQEHGLRAKTGSGMDDEQVERFVDGYYPAYELYYERVRTGALEGKKGVQLRAIVGKDRKLKSIAQI